MKNGRRKIRLNNPIEFFLNADFTILTIGTIKLYIFSGELFGLNRRDPASKLFSLS